MFRVLVFVFLLLSATAFSQVVSGVVTDEDQNPLAAVLIFNMQTEKKAYTDSNGQFAVETSPNQELRFIRQGFDRSSKMVQNADFSYPVAISLVRTAAEIEEVQVSKLRLTGDLNTDSYNLTKVDRVAQVESAVGVPGPPEKPREKPAEFKKEVIRSLLSLSIQPQAIYDLISGDARRMKAEYRYDDLQENIHWVRERVSDDYFIKMGIPQEKIAAFLQFSMGAKPDITQSVKARNLSKVLFSLEETLPQFLNR